MEQDPYWNKSYRVSVRETIDELTVAKSASSDRCELRMVINEEGRHEIMIRSKTMLEHLHFMLGQVLGKE